MNTNLNPYKQTGSVAYKTFEMAKAGTTRDALIQLFAAEEVGPARLLRELKLSDFRGITWTYEETEAGEIKITNVKGIKAAKTETKPAPTKQAPKPATKPAAKTPTAKKAAKNAKQVKAVIAKAKAASAQTSQKTGAKSAPPAAKPTTKKAAPKKAVASKQSALKGWGIDQKMIPAECKWIGFKNEGQDKGQIIGKVFAKDADGNERVVGWQSMNATMAFAKKIGAQFEEV